MTVVLLQTIGLFHQKLDQRISSNVYHSMLIIVSHCMVMYIWIYSNPQYTDDLMHWLNFSHRRMGPSRYNQLTVNRRSLERVGKPRNYQTVQRDSPTYPTLWLIHRFFSVLFLSYLLDCYQSLHVLLPGLAPCITRQWKWHHLWG